MSGVAETVHDVAAALDLLGLSLGTGLSVVASLEAVAAVSGPSVAAHLRQVAVAMRWGMPADEAWSAVPDVWRPAHQALALAESTGAPASALLEQAAEAIRRDEAVRLEGAAARLAVQLVIPLGLCFLPAFFLVAVVPSVLTLARELLPPR